MKKSRLKSQLVRDRPMKTISLRFPEDVIDDLKRVGETSTSSSRACASMVWMTPSSLQRLATPRSRDATNHAPSPMGTAHQIRKPSREAARRLG